MVLVQPARLQQNLNVDGGSDVTLSSPGYAIIGNITGQ